jgi:hypothetical protein
MSAPKLKDSQIPVILFLRREGVAFKVIAEKFGVGVQTISAICSGRSWKHLGLSHVPGLKGWSAKGEKCSLSKLKLPQVVELRRLRSQGASLPELAERFGLSKSGVWRVCADRWLHVPKEGVATANGQV